MINDIRFKTALLESLNWDEDQLQALYEYLGHAFNTDMLTHPEAIINDITKHFGESTGECFAEILKEVMDTYNLKYTGDIN